MGCARLANVLLRFYARAVSGFSKILSTDLHKNHTSEFYVRTKPEEKFGGPRSDLMWRLRWSIFFCESLRLLSFTRLLKRPRSPPTYWTLPVPAMRSLSRKLRLRRWRLLS